MSAERTPQLPPPLLQTPEQAERLAKIIEAQGKTGKSTLENLEGIAKDLWDSDEELDEFLAQIRRWRSEGG